MCLGRPALVSTHVGCGPDLVRPGETGWVFEAGRVDALAERLQHICSDRERLRQAGESARRLVREYSYEQATLGLLSALDWLERRGSPGRASFFPGARPRG
jgi:glycosyltransferase involved in cell wall biosynthesis